MKRLLLFVLAIAMVCAGSISADAAPDFSGTWVLDADKSDLGVSDPAAKAQMKVVLIIKQTSTRLSIERSTGEVAVYNLDGSESVNILPDGGQSKTNMNWSGDALVATTISNSIGMYVKQTDVRSLSADGLEMVMKVTLQIPSGERDQTLVFTKQ
jgi:hypothetical protein